MCLKNKVAIITGAGQGIGRATALRFAEEGAIVVVADIEPGFVQAVAEEIIQNGRSALAIQLDVTNRDSVAIMVETVQEKYGRIDILINNAGILRDAQLSKMSEENFDQVINVNLKGVFNCTQAVVSTMIQQGNGVIVNSASVVATYGNFGQTNYVASKAGVIGMTKVWARELGRKGIRVNAIAPGFIRTRMTDSIPDLVMEKLLERVPMKRLGEPEEIANAFLWLASDESSYITGHVLAVDGGAVI